MGCFEKVLGSLLGLGVVVLGIVGCCSHSKAQGWCLIISGIIFTLLNAISSYRDFQSFWDSIFQSAFSALLGKWIILGLISFGIAYVLCGLIFGFDLL